MHFSSQNKAFFQASVGIVNVADYSPFGVQLDGRTISNGDYRYGFQGQEKDDEIKGEGNSVNYKYRMHDPRIGRFFTVDPLLKKYPYYTPYSFSGNKVIHAVEIEGLEEQEVNGTDKVVQGPWSEEQAKIMATTPSESEKKFVKPKNESTFENPSLPNDYPTMRESSKGKIAENTQNLDQKITLEKFNKLPIAQFQTSGIQYAPTAAAMVLIPELAAPRILASLGISETVLNTFTAERVLNVGLNYMNQSISSGSVGFGDKDQISLFISALTPANIGFYKSTLLGTSSGFITRTQNDGFDGFWNRSLQKSIATGLVGATVNMGTHRSIGLMKNSFANSFLWQGFGGLQQKAINNGL